MLAPLCPLPVTLLAGMKIFKGDTGAPPFSYWDIETMDPEELGFPQEPHAGEGKTWSLCQPAGNLSPRKSVHMILTW